MEMNKIGNDMAQKQTEESLEQTNRRIENILSSISDSFYRFDREFRYVYVNEATVRMFDMPETEFLGKTLWEVFPDVEGNLFHTELLRAFNEQTNVVFENYYPPYNRWFENRAYPSPEGVTVFTSEITERKRAEESRIERERLAILNSELSLTLVQKNSLLEILQSCTEVIVEHLDAAFARIWMLDEEENVLELQASAGIYTHLDGKHSRIPIGKYKIGLIAAERKPHLTNSVVGDSRVSNQEWAQREGMVAFAGYPLIIGERLIGVIAMFARHTIGLDALKAIEVAANVIALGIEVKRAEENHKHQKLLLEALTESMTDGILIVSPKGKLLHFNQHFLKIWNFPPDVVESQSDEAALRWAAEQTINPGVFLARVSTVYQQPEREVREEIMMKDGRVFERFGAPILSSDSETRLGWVWTFHDITERKRAETNLAFLAEISQNLTTLTSSIDITRAMTSKIGKYFGASNCHFAQVDTVANTAIIDYCWCKDETAVDLTGNYQLSEFVSDEFRQTLIARKPVVVEDVETDSRTAISAAKFQALKIGSFINTPFVSDGVLRFVLGVYHSEPYGWRADEIDLLGELITRVWTRIERARAEENLRESEESYRVLAEAASDAIIRIGDDHTIQYVNTAAERIFGYAAEEMVGQQIMMLMPEELREGHHAGMDRYLRTSKRKLDWRGIEVPAQHKDGHHFPIEISFGEYNLGDTRFFIGIIRDITERRRAEESLRESEENFRDLANSISQLAWMADASGSIFWYNKRWFDYTGTTFEEMQGWGWKSVHQPEEVDRVTDKFKSHIVSGETWEDTFPLRSKTGEFRWFLSRALPIRNQKGEIVRWFGTNTDVEELRQARLQAEQANRLKDEFLATLSHELRTPLNAILGWSQMLQTHNLSESDAKKALTTIERNARAQNQLIDDLLDVSRIITGKLRLDVRAVDLASVITAAVDAARPAAEAKNIRLQILLDPQTGTISGDPDRLQQVVWNLLSNAVKFTPKGGRVQARLERINSHVEIVISDTGIGIEPEFLPHVFDRFRQSDGSMTRREGGLGLGLAIVRQLVELHGGTVLVESEGSGQGSTFTVHLPLLPVRREPAREVPRVHPKAETGALLDCPPELSDLRVLLVDDEADSRDLLNLVLSSCGAQVTVTSSASEAFEAVKREKFDVIVSDIGMPGEDGFSLIRKIRELSNEEGGDTPAIALTAYARAEDRVNALRSGFQMHVAKPVESVELVAIVANLAGRIGNPYRHKNA
jgi:PAS domain S-box-containing protein